MNYTSANRQFSIHRRFFGHNNSLCEIIAQLPNFLSGGTKHANSRVFRNKYQNSDLKIVLIANKPSGVGKKNPTFLGVKGYKPDPIEGYVGSFKGSFSEMSERKGE